MLPDGRVLPFAVQLVAFRNRPRESGTAAGKLYFAPGSPSARVEWAHHTFFRVPSVAVRGGGCPGGQQCLFAGCWIRPGH